MRTQKVSKKEEPTKKASGTSPAPDVSILTELTAANKALEPAVKRLTAVLGKLDPKKLPLGTVTDLLYNLEGAVKQLGTVAAPFTDVIAPAIKQLEEHFVNTLAVGESSGVQGHLARVQITEKVVATVEDWDKFYGYIRKKKAFELLNRAVNQKAVAERWLDKQQVPGVGKFVAKRVSCTKLGGRR